MRTDARSESAPPPEHQTQAPSAVNAGSAQTPNHLFERPLGVLARHYASTLDLKDARQPLYSKPAGATPSTLVALRDRRPRRPRGRLKGRLSPMGVQSRVFGRPTSRGVDVGHVAEILPPRVVTAGGDLNLPGISESAVAAVAAGATGPAEDSPSPALAGTSRATAEEFTRGLELDENADCGFDSFVQSLQNVMSKVERESFGDRWRAVGEWVDRFEMDWDAEWIGRNAAAILGVSVDTDHLEEEPEDAGDRFVQITATALRRHRSKMREPPGREVLGTACVILDVLLAMLCRYAPIARAAARQTRKVIMGSLFASNDAEALVPVPNLAMQRIPNESNFNRCRNTYKLRRPFSVLLDDMRKRMKAALDDAEIGEMKQERLMGVMERGMNFWKGQLLQVILRAWNGWTKSEAEKKEEAKKMFHMQTAKNVADATLVTLRAEMAALKEQHDEQVMKLEQEVQVCRGRIAELSRRLGGINADTEKQLEEGRTKCEAQVAEMKEARDLAIKHNDDFCSLCMDFTQRYLEGPAWEVARQERLGDVVHGSEGDETQLLLDWLGECVSLADIPDANKYKPKCFSDVFQMLDAYILVLNAMSPGSINSEDVQRSVAPQSAQQRAEMVLQACNKVLGFQLPLTAHDLANPDSVSMHILVSAALFQRFTDPLSAKACKRPALVPRSDLFENPLWPASQNDALRTPAAWKERMQQAWDRSSMWRAVGAKVWSRALKETVVSALSRDSAALSDKDILEMKKYVEDPLPQLDTLGSTDRGSELTSMEGSIREHALQSFQSLQSAPGTGIRRFFSTTTSGATDLKDLLASAPEQQRSEAEALRGCLEQNFHKLRAAYTYYATSDTRSTDHDLSNDEMWKMLSDCKLTSAKDAKFGFSRQVFDELVKRVKRGPGDMPPSEFVQLLVRLGYARMKGGGGVVERFSQFLGKHILPYCLYADANDFRRQLYEEDVQNILAANRNFCNACYRTYGRVPRTTAGPRKFSMEEFTSLATDLTITDSILTHDAVRQIFVKIGNPTKTPDSDEWCITFQAFIECLCGLAVFKTPAPYLPLFRRISRFFDIWFVPILSDTARFKRIVEENERLNKKDVPPSGLA